MKWRQFAQRGAHGRRTYRPGVHPVLVPPSGPPAPGLDMTALPGASLPEIDVDQHVIQTDA